MVALRSAHDNGLALVGAMQSVNPAGLTPLVPALTGVFKYAMTQQQREPSAEKAVVLLSDGFPTLCDLRSPGDVGNVIADAAAAVVPIRTFIIGVGSPATLDSAKFNLMNYASLGKTGTPPYLLDEAEGANAMVDQLVNALLHIAASSRSCTYNLSTTATDAFHVRWESAPSVELELPRVASLQACSASAYGGFFVADPAVQSEITLCPCSCANTGAKKLNALHGCAAP